mmetsp:Transcript_84802/g.235129  ORF Transcript_84802/g.235129 Transcript_84802/m.235129 type:complete len:225 (+) Transcript_84802:1269-1943(+)
MDSMAFLFWSNVARKKCRGLLPCARDSGKIVMVTLKRKPTRQNTVKALKISRASRSRRAKPTCELTKLWRMQMIQFTVICRVPTTVINTPVGKLPAWSTNSIEYFASGTNNTAAMATKLMTITTMPMADRHASPDVSKPKCSQTTSGGSQTTSRIVRLLILPLSLTHLSVPLSTGGSHSGVMLCGSIGVPFVRLRFGGVRLLLLLLATGTRHVSSNFRRTYCRS